MITILLILCVIAIVITIIIRDGVKEANEHPYYEPARLHHEDEPGIIEFEMPDEHSPENLDAENIYKRLQIRNDADL